MSQNVIITPYIGFDVTVVFHHNGEEQEYSLEEIVDISVHPHMGKTMVTVFSGNPDCEHEWFQIDETVEEAKNTVKEAEELLSKAKENYKITSIQ